MKTKERVFLGILGALLGSILGSVSIVLENQVSNTFSLIGGVVMADRKSTRLNSSHA